MSMNKFNPGDKVQSLRDTIDWQFEVNPGGPPEEVTCPAGTIAIVSEETSKNFYRADIIDGPLDGKTWYFAGDEIGLIIDD